MDPRQVKVWRGTVFLAEKAGDVLQASGSWRGESSRVEECSFDASPTVAPARFAAVRHACQNASGGSYFVFLGGSYRPVEGGVLRLQIAITDAGGAGLHSAEAQIVSRTLAETISRWSVRPSGVILVDHALIHEVDNKPWTWRAASEVLAALFSPGASTLDDAEIDAITTSAFRGRASSP
jgi:hypothetical protein